MSQVSSSAPALPAVASRPYQPDGGFQPHGLTLLFSALILAGAALGYVGSLINNVFWLILLFPIGIGLVLGAIGCRMVKIGKVRSPMIGALAGLAGGIFAMLAMHYFDYKQDVGKAMKNPDVAAIMQLSPADRANLIKTMEEPERAQRIFSSLESFYGYMDFNAHEGVEISHRSSKGINLGYTGTWIYWAVEVLIVAGMTLVLVRGETQKPYCRPCEQWKVASTLGSFADPVKASSSLSSGDVNEFIAAKPTAALNDLVLYAHNCPTCNGSQSSTDLKMIQYVPAKDGKTTENVVKFVSWPGESLPVLKSMFTEPPVAQPPPIPQT